MLLVILPVSIVLAGYVSFIVGVAKGWHRLSRPVHTSARMGSLFVSVIIPFRNEAANLPRLLARLEKQSFPRDNMEVLMVDDGSTDEGPDYIREQLCGLEYIRLFTSAGEGKKKALHTGIAHSRGELIVTTDADCCFGDQWLATLADGYLAENPDLIVGPVTMTGGNSLSSYFQSLDYLSLQMTTAGTAGAGNPIMCSGANLAFRKTAWLRVQPYMRGDHLLSGDDVFLLHAMKKASFHILYLKNPKAMVAGAPAASVKDFIVQRARWGGKSKAYNDIASLATAVLVFSLNLMLAVLFISAFFYRECILLWAAAMLVKMVSDGYLLRRGQHFFAIEFKPAAFFFFSIFYPFYILLAAIAGWFANVTWKGRRTEST